MPDYQKIGELKIFVNSRSYLYCDFTETERIILGNKLKDLYETLIKPYEVKNILYVECSVAQNSDLFLTLTLYVKYIGLHPNLKDYPEVFEFIKFIVEEFSNAVLQLNDTESFKIAVFNQNVAPYHIAIKLFEKAEAELMKGKNDNKYVLFENEESLKKHFSDRLVENFEFINCHRTTGLHEVDIKLLESRYSVAC